VLGQIKMVGQEKRSKLVYVMPWLRLSTGQHGVHRVPIGPAVFTPDDDQTWAEVVGRPRPHGLDIFRSFPDDEEQQEPDVARGTLLVSDDEPWLEEHIHLLVSLVYALGQPDDDWQTPAERFRYFGYRVSDTPSDTLSLVTKKGELWEDRRSLRLFPPLELRGVHKPYMADVHDPRNKALIQRFVANPDDRLVVAARHLFRTQFADPFGSPWDQDYASYCACLEAALDLGMEPPPTLPVPVAPSGWRASLRASVLPFLERIGLWQRRDRGPQPGRTDIGKELGRRLAQKYHDLKDMPEWIEGLYACRVVFVHGLAGDTTLQERQKQLRDAFLARRGNHDILRNFCRDIIREQLQVAESETERLFRQLVNSKGIPHRLECFFNSDHLWQVIRGHLGVDKAADKVRAFDRQQSSDFFRACVRYVSDHRWAYTQARPTDEQVFRVLISLVLLIAKSGKATEAEMRAVRALGDATDSKDKQTIAAWARQQRSWARGADNSDPLGAHRPTRHQPPGTFCPAPSGVPASTSAAVTVAANCTATGWPTEKSFTSPWNKWYWRTAPSGRNERMDALIFVHCLRLEDCDFKVEVSMTWMNTTSSSLMTGCPPSASWM
jgi:hypothetical protein